MPAVYQNGREDSDGKPVFPRRRFRLIHMMFVTIQKVLAAQGLRLRVEPEEAARRMSAGMGGRRSMMGRKTAHKKK
jgi:hypothetical protein